MSRQRNEPVTVETLALPSDECRVLQALRQTPEILDLISGWTDAELGLQAVLRRQYPNDLV